MDDKKKIIKAIILILVIVACIPVRYRYKDGGSVQYRALLYSVMKVRQMTDMEEEMETGRRSHTGYEVCILGISIYDSSCYGVMCTLERQLDYTVVYTNGGLEIAETNKYIQGEKGGKTVYQNVPTQVERFEWKEASDMPPITIVYERQADGTGLCWKEYYGEDGQKELHTVDAEGMDYLNTWVDWYHIKKWDGFDMSDTGVCDGWGFTMNITLSTGETITTKCYMVYPSNYKHAFENLEYMFDTY